MSELSDKSDAFQGLKFSYLESEKALKTIAFSPLLPEKYDYVEVDYSTGDDKEVYIFMIGGSTGTVSGTLLLTYTDTKKTNLKSVAKVV